MKIKRVTNKQLEAMVRNALVASFLKTLPGQVRDRMSAIREAFKNNR